MIILHYIVFYRWNILSQWNVCCCLLFVIGLQAVRHARIMRRWSSNLGQWPIQPSRLWVPNPYSLSPTRRSKPTFQWQGTNERIHRQWQQGTKWTKDRHGGHQFTYGSQLPRLRHKGPSSFQNTQRDHYSAAWELATARVPEHLQSSLPKVLRLSKLWSWTSDPEHRKYRSILLGTTSPRWDL